jgi:ferredoxin/pSer/pThr/pTyr-binding forkhead associated (FHA) protein
MDGRTHIELVIADAAPAGHGTRDIGINRITAALGLSPETSAMVDGAAAGDVIPEQQAWIVSMTPTGVEAEQFSLRDSATTTIGRTGCDITFANDTALSDVHASITFRNGNCHLRDEGSRGGTYLKVRPDNPVAVVPGALLRAGRQLLVVGQDAGTFHIDQYDTAGRALRRHRLGAGQVVFGRRAGPSHPDVALDDSDMTLSRFHLSASVQGAVVVIHDFNSRNSTYLKIDGEHWLDHNDVFRVGNQLFQLKLHEDLPEKTGSAPVPALPEASVTPQPAPPAVTAQGGQPHITFTDQNIAGDADPGETLLEWADARDVAIDNECWIGMCGCDTIRIVEGQQFLNEVAEKELKTLKRKGLEPGPYRLACMARCSGPIVVEVVE